MGRGGGRGGHHPAARRPVDLTGLLLVAEKNDLFTLVNAITEKLHRDISNIFDSPPVRPIVSENHHHHWLLLPLRRKDGLSHNPLGSITNIKPESPDSYEKTRDIIEKEEKQAMTPQLGELKKEAELYFRKWQGLILQRVRDISVNECSDNQTATRGRGRGVRGGVRGRGGRGGRGRGGALTLATGPPRAPPTPIDLDLANRFQPLPNPLWALPLEKRKLLLHVVLLLTLSLQEFTANSHLLLLNLTSSLNLPLKFLQAEETKLCQGLAGAALDVSQDDLLVQKTEEKGGRKWKSRANNTGIPTSLAPGLTTAGVGTPHGSFGLTTAAAAGLLGTMADNGRALTGLFGMNPTKPVGKMMESFGREIQDFGFMPLWGEDRSAYCDARQRPADDRRLRLVIAMSGWVIDEDDVVKPWRCLGSHTESYAVRWDLTALTNLGGSLETVIKSNSWASAKKEFLTRSIFNSLMDSMWPVSLLKISKIIDNPWNVGMVRAEKAGAVLADAVMRHKFQGDRPVSLVGYGLAARAIYACLMVLAERRQFGLIDSVVMMGAPVPSESRVWLTLKSVVCGRLINVYSEQDYLLGFLYRTSNIHFGVAGLQEIQGADGVENHSVGDMPKGHLGYQYSTAKILMDIGWEELDRDVVKREQPGS